MTPDSGLIYYRDAHGRYRRWDGTSATPDEIDGQSYIGIDSGSGSGSDRTVISHYKDGYLSIYELHRKRSARRLLIGALVWLGLAVYLLFVWMWAV